MLSLQPTSALTGCVRRHRPHAVLLTCMIPAALPALLDAVDQMHQLATPVFVGGRALGVTPCRAEAVGADGWAPNATLAASLLDQPAAPAPPATALGRLTQYRDVREQLPAWSARAMSELAARLPADALAHGLSALCATAPDGDSPGESWPSSTWRETRLRAAGR